MLLNQLHDIGQHWTRAYALGGMQVICKHTGVFKRTVLPN